MRSFYAMTTGAADVIKIVRGNFFARGRGPGHRPAVQEVPPALLVQRGARPVGGREAELLEPLSYSRPRHVRIQLPPPISMVGTLPRHDDRLGLVVRDARWSPTPAARPRGVGHDPGTEPQ